MSGGFRTPEALVLENVGKYVHGFRGASKEALEKRDTLPGARARCRKRKDNRAGSRTRSADLAAAL